VIQEGADLLRSDGATGGARLRNISDVSGRACFVVAYDGASFHGFAPSDPLRTVASVLTEALSKVARTPVKVTGAGRTDAGVHAWAQVVSCDLPTDVDLVDIARRVSSMCGPALVVRRASWVAPDFDARFSALWRHYRYTVWNSPVQNPFLATTAWHVDRPLDIDLLRLACDPFIGEHDFAAFCRRPKVGDDRPAPSLVRRVMLTRWSSIDDELLRFEIRANAFCHQMVRSMVGTMVDVGLGRVSPGELSSILRRRDRSVAGQVAPPHGLCLWEVGYPPGVVVEHPPGR
jgi:tRNA pseudouridine38-40 synthase